MSRSRPKRLLAAACLLLGCAGTAKADPASTAAPARWSALADPVFQTLGVAAGLPNPMALAAVQDRNGFLWIGTGSGLARWDGYRFRTYAGDGQNPDDLPDTYVQALHLDHNGALWIGTSAGGLVRYDPDHDSFVPVSVANARSARIEIRAFADDDKSGLLVGGGGGLYHLDTQAARPRLVPKTRDEVFGLPAGRVLSLLRDRLGALWVGTGHGVFRRDRGAAAFEPVPLPALKGAPSAVKALGEDSAGQVWIATTNTGAFVIDAARASATQIRSRGQSADSLETMDVEAVGEARPGEMWLGTTGHGIIVVDTQTLQVRRIRHDASRPTSLADDSVSNFFRDQSGLLWTATDSGLSFEAPARDGIRTLFARPGAPNRISDPNTTAMMAAPDGQVWLGLEHDGVAVIDAAAQRISLVSADPSLPGAIVSGVASLSDQDYMIGTWHGLFHVDKDGHAAAPVALARAQQDSNVGALGRIGSDLWLADTDNIYRLRPQAGATAEVMFGSSLLTDKRARTILSDGAGRIWIGTWDGLNLYDPAAGRITQALADPAGPSSLSSGLITCLTTDRQGRLWVGTVGGGINILTGRSPAGVMLFRHLAVEDGLPNPNVDKLLMAADGHIWASTDDGLAEIDPITLRIKAFHLADGVAIPAYWADSGAITRQGELLFGGAGGVTIVRPERMETPLHHLHLVATDLRIGDTEMPAIRTDAKGAVQPLVISPDANSVSVEFSALDYADPGRDHYAYKLIGMDKKWIGTDPTRRLAAYTNLPPGNFTLALRATDPSGESAEAELLLPIVVLPAWYQTFWAVGAFMLLALLFVVSLIRASTNLLRRRQAELEQLIEKRTVELSRSNEALTGAADTLSTLSTIGQQITASLDLETVLMVLHENMSSLIDAPYFAVYLMGGSDRRPALRFGMRNGHRVVAGDAMEEHADILMRAIGERREIASPYDGPSGAMSERSLICAPLVVFDRVLGAIVVQSWQVGAYHDRERLIFRTLCDYGAVALSNAETLVALADVKSRLEQMAYSDGLTDLPNRRVFIDRFNQFVVRYSEEGQQFALLLLDLDGFKTINDTYGHDTGDALLVETAERLRSIVRGTDVVIRLGGDEFAVLLGSVDGPGQIEEVCRRITESFAHGLRFKNTVLETSASIGVAVFPNDGETQERLYKAADLALYAVKKRGGGDAVFFEPALRDAALGDLAIKQDLSRAIELKQLAIHYQPLCSVPARRVCGFEALLRWRHPERGMIPPSEFIPIAEESGLIAKLGRFVLTDAVARARRWRDRDEPVIICVNLSVRHLSEGSVCDFLSDLLDDGGVDPAAICVEVTESALMNEAALAELHRLRNLGVKISIDDFGTGYSSLAYLSALPVDTVKIDRSFIAPLGSDDKANRIFRAIVDLAHTLDLHTIAEGCETEEQWRAIAAAGCHEMQGWLFARAMDDAAAEQFLAANRRSLVTL